MHPISACGRKGMYFFSIRQLISAFSPFYCIESVPVGRADSVPATGRTALSVTLQHIPTTRALLNPPPSTRTRSAPVRQPDIQNLFHLHGLTVALCGYPLGRLAHGPYNTATKPIVRRLDQVGQLGRTVSANHITIYHPCRHLILSPVDLLFDVVVERNSM